jgi:hypothetical protein
MATYTKYEDFVEQLAKGVHQLHAAGHTVRAVIHSDAPTTATDDELADLSQVTGTGYTAGGEDAQNDVTRSGGTAKLVATDVVWTGGAGGFTAGQYISLHNDTSTTDKLICSWNYGSSFTVAVGETFTVDFGTEVFQLA